VIGCGCRRLGRRDESIVAVAERNFEEAAEPGLNAVLEAERAVLGRILRDNAEYGQVAGILRPEHFTERLHWGVFDEARRLIEAGELATPARILPRVGTVGLGGALAGPYLDQLIAAAPSAADLRSLAGFLVRAARDRAAKPAQGAGYEDDFYLWANEQAERLRRGEWSRLDALNLAEEIEDLGREVYNELESRFRIILLHLLKWDHQPQRRTRGWTASIDVQRLDAERLLAKHPSLRPRVPEAIREAYRRARIEAGAETGLDQDAFSLECPYRLDEIMTRPVPWPPQ
jgi:hypothetical protein